MGKESVFSYFITESNNAGDLSFPELSVKRIFGEYTVFTDGNTPYASAVDGTKECAIFGLAVDVVSGRGDDLACEIVKNCKNIQDVVEYEKNLGGKYILLFRQGTDCYIQGDATSSIPVFYSTERPFVCSSNPQNVVNVKKYCVDSAYAQIRKSGDISQAMPYDITPYRQIKQLIPNHYLDVSRYAAVRFINSHSKQNEISVEEATQTVLPMIENILDLYLRHYKIYCPITSGRDSRVVLAFLLNHTAEFSCYTIKHPHHNDKTQDITVPIELCEKIGIQHRLVEDVKVPDTVTNEMDTLLGDGNYSRRTLQISQTVKEYFGDGAIINGDIIGQVGKCSLHRDIPALFATASYFRCKLHNYSEGAKEQLKLWLEEINASGERVNRFDLFSVENRMGRWAAQENLIYNLLGQVYLNIFNSRRIVYTWTAVSRKERKLSKLHIDLINNTYGTLTEIPFEREENIIFKLSKATGMAYLLSSYAKYYLEKHKFRKGAEL